MITDDGGGGPVVNDDALLYGVDGIGSAIAEVITLCLCAVDST